MSLASIRKRCSDWFAGLFHEPIEMGSIDMRQLHLELHRHYLDAMRRTDEVRIMTRQDVNLEALKYRMANGRRPKKQMLSVVAPIWAKKAEAALPLTGSE